MLNLVKEIEPTNCIECGSENTCVCNVDPTRKPDIVSVSIECEDCGTQWLADFNRKTKEYTGDIYD